MLEADDTKSESVAAPEYSYPDEKFKELIDAGVFYGRKSTKTHPRMKPYVFRTYNNIEIVNLNKTEEGLGGALSFLKEKIRRGGKALLIGTQPTNQEMVLEMAKEFNFPAVINRWLGGTLTNFKIISGRIEYYKKLKAEAERGELEKYTKKERLKINEEIKKLTGLLGSMENYNSLPDVIIMIDPVVHKTALREARHLKIPVIALANTDADPELIDYPVVGNTKSRKSVNWFLEKISEAIREAKNLAAESTAAVETTADSTSDSTELSKINKELAVE